MSRSPKPRKSKKPSYLSVWQRLACAVVVVAPPLVLVGRLGFGLLDYLDAILAQSTPLASAFASASVGREVRIGSLTPFLSTRELWSYYKRIGTLGTIPVVAENITVANGASLETSGELAYIKQVRAFVSVPALLSGQSNAAVTRIEIESPRLLLVRRKDGSLNVQELVKEETKPGGPPFLTTIELTDAAIRFVDRATMLPTEQTTELYPVSGTAILAASTLRFDVKATPKAGTATAKRIGGTVAASGTAAQGKPGSRPNAALATDPAFTLRILLPDADIPYFAAYAAGKVPNVRIDAGRIKDVSATLVGATVAQTEAAAKIKNKSPKSKAKNAEPPLPSVLLTAKLAGVGGRVEGLPTDLQNFGGDIRFVSEGDLVSFDLGGNVFAAPVTLAGTVWNLTKPAPNLAVRFDAPRVPLSRVLPAFKATLPPGITVAGDAKTSGFLTGTATNISGTASVFVPQVGVQGKATVRNIAADLQVGGGVLQVSKITAQTDLSGNIRGSGRVRFGEIVPGKTGATLKVYDPKDIAADFSVAVDRVSLPRAASLAGKDAVPKNLRLQGTASIAASGSVRGGKVSLTADAATQGLTLNNTPFSVAQARIVVRDNAVIVPLVRLQSPGIGTLLVSGDSSLLAGTAGGSAPVSLNFTANALDIGKLAGAFGVPNVGGVLNAVGSVGGTLDNPRLTLKRFALANPRYDKYRLQSVTGANITVTKNALTIPAATPVVARRSPATVTVSGRVTDFLPATPTAKPRPRLALRASVADLDYSTIAPYLPPPDPKALPVAGTLTSVRAEITGFADAPRVAGMAIVRRVLVGDYPLEYAAARFVYDNGAVQIPSLTVTASAGTLSAQGSITRGGEVSGSFIAPALDLSRLSYLTQDTASLSGSLAIRGTFSGTRDRPVITASIDPSDIVVAGTEINNLAATDVRYIANLSQGVQRVEIPRISLEQAGNTALLVENGSYDFKRKTFGTTVQLRSDSVGEFLSTLARSPFAQTPNGKTVIAAIRSLPSPFDGAFPATRTGADGAAIRTNRVTVAGIAGEKGVGNYRVTGEVYVQNLRAGMYAADDFRATLSRGNTAVEVPFGQPNIGVDVQGTNITINDVLSSNLSAKGSLVGETATVDQLLLASNPPKAVVAAAEGVAVDAETGKAIPAPKPPKEYTFRVQGSGTAGLGENGRINAQIDANAVDFDFVRAFVPTLPLEGTFDVTAFATGATKTPDVQASVGAQDVVFVPRTVAGKVEGQAGEPKAIPATPERFSVNAIARVRADKTTGNRFLELSSGQLTRRGGGQLLADAKVPFSYDSPYVLPNEPIVATLTFPDFPLETLNAITATDTDPQKKGKKQKKDEATGLRFFGGDIKGQVTLAGTLRTPELSGGITLTDGSFALPKVAGSETFNRIKDWDAEIALAGSTVTLDSTIALAKPDGTGDNGKLILSGEAVVKELETALNSLGGVPAKAASGERAPAGSGTVINRFTAKFDGLQVDENNLLYLAPEKELTAAELKANRGRPIIKKPQNEQFRAKIDGTLTVSGSVTSPLIATPPNAPLTLTKVRVVPPIGGSSNENPKPLVDGGPRFAIEINAPEKSNVTIPRIASVDVSGSATISGNAGRPAVRGRFVSEGGVLQYYIGRFTVDKGGQAILNFAGDRGDVTFDNVAARTTAYLRPGATLSGLTQKRGEPPIAASQPGLDGAGTRYKITARLEDKLFFGAGSDDRNGTFKLSMTSDPPLAEAQIAALLIPQATLADAAAGDLTKAGTQLLTTALQQSVLPGLFAPLEQSLANTFGLETFSLDYSPSSPLNITLQKRLPDPLQRFVVQYTRSLQTSSRTNVSNPYTVGLLYELYELRTKPGQPIPRLQFGFFTDEQRTFSGSLRATILY